MSKSRFIISVRSQFKAQRHELLTEFLSLSDENEIDILSDRDTAPTSGWIAAQMEEYVKEKMETKFAGKLVIEPDSELQY